jgi:hypothetical protein
VKQHGFNNSQAISRICLLQPIFNHKWKLQNSKCVVMFGVLKMNKNNWFSIAFIFKVPIKDDLDLT